MRLESVMNTSVEVIGPHASIATAERRLKRKGIHHLVVVDHNVIVGLLTHDILRHRKAEGATRVEDAMLRNITLASMDTTVRDAAALMSPGHAQTAVPIVHDQRLVGIVTVSDLLNLAASAHEHVRRAPTAAR
jgi:CBS domain-containing protein